MLGQAVIGLSFVVVSAKVILTLLSLSFSYCFEYFHKNGFYYSIGFCDVPHNLMFPWVWFFSWNPVMWFGCIIWLLYFFSNLSFHFQCFHGLYSHLQLILMVILGVSDEFLHQIPCGHSRDVGLISVQLGSDSSSVFGLHSSIRTKIKYYSQNGNWSFVTILFHQTSALWKTKCQLYNENVNAANSILLH